MTLARTDPRPSPSQPLRLDIADSVDWRAVDRHLSGHREEHYAVHPGEQRELHALLRDHATAELDVVLARAAQALEVTGRVVIGGVTTSNLALVALVAAFGGVSAEGNEHDAQLVYEVTPESEPPSGSLARSRQRIAFPLHTDTSWLPQPHDYIALLGVTAAATSSTKSLTLHVDQIVKELERADVDALCQPLFPVPTQGAPRYVSILESCDDGGFRIRYRGDVLERGARIGLDASARTALQHLDDVVATASPATFSIDSGELLILDNRRMLHGRSEINGQRLVKRLRLRKWKAFAARPVRATRVSARTGTFLRAWARGVSEPPAQPVERDQPDGASASKATQASRSGARESLAALTNRGIDPGLRRRLVFLEQLGARARRHSGGALLSHLVGTRGLLAKWGCEKHVCDAGLFHSVYATENYTSALLGIGERSTLAALIGESAEEVAYLFSRMNRSAFLGDAQMGCLGVQDRETGEPIPVEPEFHRALCDVLVANWLEQRDGVERLGASTGDAYRPLMRHLSPAAADQLNASIHETGE